MAPTEPKLNDLLEAIREAESSVPPPPWMSVAQISQELGLSNSTTKTRLGKLMQEGKVERMEVNRPRGGTRMYYKLKENGKP